MRKSLGDALKNVFEETTMKNVPIDQFRSFKSRNRVQNQNLHEKMSKIGHFRNFNFLVKGQRKSQSQRKSKSTNLGQSQLLELTSQIQVVRVNG